jgi:hypothetical protein
MYSWQPLAAFEEMQGFAVFGQRLPGGNLWQPLAPFETEIHPRFWQPLTRAARVVLTMADIPRGTV